MNNIGIYCIKNKINNKVYIGLSKNLERRKIQHISCLRGGYHFNTKLQNAFNKYGEENFEWSILEYTDLDSLSDKEVYYIKKFNSVEKGYNIENGGLYNKEISEETKQKLSNSRIGSKNHNSIVDDETAENILLSLMDFDKEIKDIAEDFNVSLNVVYNLQQNRSYTYLLKDKRDYIKNRKKISDNTRLLKAIEYVNEGNSYSDASRKFNVSRNTIRRYLNKQANTEVTNSLKAS